MTEPVTAPPQPAAAEPSGTPPDTGAPQLAGALLPTGAGGVEMVAKFFRALGDPVRLRLLEFLLGDEHTVTECVEHIGLAQSRISTHLGCLSDCGYVAVRRAGRQLVVDEGDDGVEREVTGLGEPPGPARRPGAPGDHAELREGPTRSAARDSSAARRA